MFMAGDSTANLHTALDMYREQVRELQGMELGLVTSYIMFKSTYSIFSGRKIVLFMSGDYEFLTRIYGLSGASGKHII